jgi:hypothetical protein
MPTIDHIPPPRSRALDLARSRTRLGRVALHAKALLCEPWHTLSRCARHLAGICREVWFR